MDSIDFDDAQIRTLARSGRHLHRSPPPGRLVISILAKMTSTKNGVVPPDRFRIEVAKRDIARQVA
jgi:hypothetical protein